MRVRVTESCIVGAPDGLSGVLTLSAGEIIEGPVAIYLVATGSPVHVIDGEVSAWPTGSLQASRSVPHPGHPRGPQQVSQPVSHPVPPRGPQRVSRRDR